MNVWQFQACQFTNDLYWLDMLWSENQIEGNHPAHFDLVWAVLSGRLFQKQGS